MSETPEAEIVRGFIEDVNSRYPVLDVATLAALEALASLRQRQEETERLLDKERVVTRALNGDIDALLADRESLRTQLQQAEQERDAEKHRADKLQKNIDSNLAAYSDWTVERKAVESQLQQAETALREASEWHDAWPGTRHKAKLSQWLHRGLFLDDKRRAALAAPPPNTKDTE